MTFASLESSRMKTRISNDDVETQQEHVLEKQEHVLEKQDQASKTDDITAPSPLLRRCKQTENALQCSSQTSSAESWSQEELGATKTSSSEVRNRKRKRSDYLSWDDYFMGVAFLSAQRSKDPSTQVGACIVNSDNKIVGIGYNGFPVGCDDDDLPWDRHSDDPLDTKYPYVCHAEMNAILNKNSQSVKDCRIYVGLFPCNECAKIIIQSGIKELIYCSDKYQERWQFQASRKLLNMAGVHMRQHTPKASRITIDFTAVDN